MECIRSNKDERRPDLCFYVTTLGWFFIWSDSWVNATWVDAMKSLTYSLKWFFRKKDVTLKNWVTLTFCLLIRNHNYYVENIITINRNFFVSVSHFLIPIYIPREKELFISWSPVSLMLTIKYWERWVGLLNGKYLT